MGVRRKSVLPVVSLDGCLCLNFPLCSFGSECDSLGLLASAQTSRSFEALVRNGETWLWVTQWVMIIRNNQRFRVIGCILLLKRNPNTLPWRELVVMHSCCFSILRRTCFSVTSVSLAFEILCLLGDWELIVSNYWILFRLPAECQCFF